MTAFMHVLSFLLILTALVAISPVVSAPCPVAAADTWTAMTSGTSNILTGVWGSSGSDVFAVGTFGTILHYNGSTWSTMNSGGTENLTAVWGSSGSDVFVVGHTGTILHYNGSAWSTMTSGSIEDLNGIWGSSGSNIFAAGANSTILHYNGSAWSAVISPLPGKQLSGIWGSSDSDIYIVGESGTLLHYNGAVWSDNSPGIGNNLYGIWGSASSDIFAVGGGNSILHYNGSSWSSTTFSMMNYHNSIWGSSGSDVYIAGNVYGGPGFIKHYDGSTWDTVTGDGIAPLNGIWGSCSNDIFAVGNDGTILHYGSGCWNINASVVGGGSISPSGQVIIYGGDSETFTITPNGFFIIGDVQVDGQSVGAASSYTFTNVIANHTISASFTRSPTTGTPGGSGSTTNPQQSTVSLSSINVKSATLSASRVAQGEPVTVNASVVNSGTANGSSLIKLYVNGQEETGQGVNIESGRTAALTFTVSRNEPGTYTVYVGGTQAGSFVVEQFVDHNIVLYVSIVLISLSAILGIIYVWRKRQYKY